MPLSPPPIDERLLRDLLLVLDLAGTFVFALSGAMLAVRRKLDFFGVLALSFVAGSAGGIARDLLIGSVPPAAISDWRYFAAAMAAGLLIFFWYSPISRLHRAILILDAAGLALFAVAGAEKALAFGLNPLTAALLGMLTGIAAELPATSWLPGRPPFSRAIFTRSQRSLAQGSLSSAIFSSGRWYQPRSAAQRFASGFG